MKVLYNSFLNGNIKKIGGLSRSVAAKLFIAGVFCFGLQAHGQQNSSAINLPDKKLQSTQVSVSGGSATTAWTSTNTPPAHAANFEDQRNKKTHSSTGTVRKSNFTFFSDTHVNTNAEVAEYNKGYENDPELGVLYANAPCTNCYEILEKRTATQKYFVQEGTQATKFILQSSSGPVHYKDHTGRWRTIGEHLTPVNAQPGVYATNNRETDASINIQKGCATLSRLSGKLTYNNNLELIYIKPDGTELSLGLADWSKNTAGDDGVHITNAWAGIDMEIGVLKNGIKTNFIINSAMPGYADGKLVIRDHIIADNGMAIDEHINQAYSGTVSIKSNGNELFVMQKAIAFEQNNAQKTIKNLNYKIGYNNSLDIEIPGSLLNKTAASYPLIIDPMVTSSVAVSGFSYDYYLPTGGSPGLDCITTNNVTIPAAATFTDIQVSYTFYGGTGIPWTYAGYDLFIGATCGTTFLSCTSGSGSGLSGGTCGSINESEWGAATAGYWSTCVPAFSCTSYTLDFEIVTAQDWGTDAACGTAYFASATNFIVNVFGTVAIPTAISPAGPGTLCMPSTLSLTGIPAGGTWSSSGTASVTTGGVVTGTSNGAADITYTAGSCSAVYALTVGTTPTITGPTSICYTGSPADTVDLTGTPSGGTWTSGTTGVATITTTDPARVTAAGTGTTLITYNTGTCSATIPVNVTAGTAVAPLSQPSLLTFSGTTASGTIVSFTTVTADGYLVIASTSPTLSATPVNNTVYTTGSAFGGGTVIVSSLSGSAPSYTISSLTSNTKYYVFVFSFNNNCSGPQYDVIAPLTGNFSTCVLPPTALTVGTIGINTVALSWTASPAGGGHISPINYVVHAYTDAAMTTLAAGYPVSVGSVTSYTAGGLLTSTQYYFTVNAVDLCATPSNEVTATTSCTGTTATIPYIQTFDISPTISYLFPDCMGSSAANCIAAGVQNSVTYPGFGSITADHTTSSSAGYFYNFAPYGYCGVNQRYQWLLTPGLVMTAGTTYKLSFWYKVTSGSGVWNGIKAQWSADGTVPTTSTMTSAISTPAFASSCIGGWNQLTGTMTPASSGVYYVGICAVQTTTADTHFIGIDDVEVCAIPTITASNGTAPYCAPATIDLTTTSTYVTDYLWTGPGGFSSTLASPVTINTTTGTAVYTITGVNDPTTIYGMGGYCSATTTTSLTIHATPAAITGSAGICISTPVTLGETSAGGTWSATPTTVATVSTTGVVTGTGSAGGTATISYTTTGPCSATFPVTVSPGIPTLTITANPIPARCPGINSTVTYVATNTPTSYSLTWTSSPPGLPDVASGTPLPPSPVTVVDLSTVSVGTYTGIFAVTNACGTTSATLTFNILSAPPVISGSLNVCVGATSVLSDASPGGIWSSVSTSIATINPSTGLLDGISSGTTTISYSLGVGCSRTAIATVNVSPTSITGPTTICLGTSGTLNDLTVGGTWTSSNTLVATVTDIGSGSVVVTSVGGGIDTITYATGGCTATYVITVTPTPIIGIDSMCVGATVTLTDATPGGTWSSVSGGIATITSGGVVMGISSGTSVISYTIGTCAETVVVTVDPTPTVITGPDSICLGSTVTLTETVTGGGWTSVTTTVATVVAPGYVTGAGIGTSVISYAIYACSTSVTVTVNNAPAAISGTPLSICQYTTTTLTDATGGGTWRSVTPAIATVTGGAVYGVAAGTDTISYTIGSCAATVVVTVNLAPTAITGALTVCRFDSTLLSDPVATGTWHSVTTTIATVDAAGEVTGVTAGTDTISYTIGTCTTTVVVTVNNGPAAITGTDYVCELATTTLSDIVSGGTWTSVTGSIATVSSSGVVSGISAGTDTISYTVGSCSTYVVVTVNTMPAALTGTFNVCVGSVTTLSESVTGTSWRSGTPSVATVDASGDVTGIGAGTSTITDSIGNCKVTAVVTVNGIPTAIAGDVLMCVGGSAITLTDAVPGGTWSGGATGIATINPSPGYVTPLGGGTTDVTYTTVCGSVTATITVHATPATITGTNNICVGNTITLTESVSLGTWSSSATGVATVDISGDVYGASQGIANISYSTGCGSPAVFPVTVNSAPVAITGTLTVCVGSVTILSDASTGGTWTSGTTSVATVNPTNGHVGGISYGTSVITYSNGCGADVYATVTVNATPTAITGTTNVCVGSTTSLTETVPGGIWSSSATGIATVDVSGDVYGVSQGLVTITYATGCGAPVTHAMTVNAAPVAITGTLTVCVGSITILSDASTGGTWTSGTTSVATVNPANGHVTGIANGTSEITYSNGCGADVYATVTVNTTPAAITGTTNVCVGNTIALTETIPYGTWTSSATGIATVDISGDVTGIAQGLVNITYSTGCGSAAVHAMTVNATPVAITGTFYVCTGSITILSETSTGGTWTSGTTSVATVNPANGHVGGISNGTSIITYSNGCGSDVYATVTVNAAAGPITGAALLCTGSTLSLVDTVLDGTWSISGSAATIGSSTGVVTGISCGTSFVTYTTGCGTPATVSITVSAAPVTGSITGNVPICTGSTLTLSDLTSCTGSWSGGTVGIATTSGSTTSTSVGIVSGPGHGTVTITYSTGCGSPITAVVTVNAAPGPITGVHSICTGSCDTVSDTSLSITWSSSATTIVTIDPISGVYCGISQGTATITASNGCSPAATYAVTVHATPAPISGLAVACVGFHTTLSNTATGGTWSSADTTIARVDSLSGVITGEHQGTVVITYSNGCGSPATVTVTINAVPGPITGTQHVCVGNCATLSDTSTDIVWSSGALAVATVNSVTGVYCGVAQGITVITGSNGCVPGATITVTVNAAPSVISGTLTACIGGTTGLTNASTGGIWTSGNTLIATVDSMTGVVSGIDTGTVGITYDNGCGAAATVVVTVHTTAGPISGNHAICAGATLTLSDSVSGGVWGGGTAGIATTLGTTTGTTVVILSGPGHGTTNITYFTGCGAPAIVTVTVNGAPVAITGTLSLCAGGATTTLHDSATGGVWSGGSGIANIDSFTGIVTSDSSGGTAIFTYSNGCGAAVTVAVTINPLPVTPTTITGSMTVCIGATASLHDAVAGGTWSSANTGIARVNSFGVDSGASAGIDTIIYTMSNSCGTASIFTVITVNPLPVAGTILGPSSVCLGSHGTYTDTVSAAAGGTWSSRFTSIATIDSTTGILSTVAYGVDTIKYTRTSLLGCAPAIAKKVVTIDSFPTAPAPITGGTHVCRAAHVFLSDASAGYTWSSSNNIIATVSTSGVVAGLTAGVDTIYYTHTNGCGSASVMHIDTVRPLPLHPGLITGIRSLCIAGTTTLSDTSVSGTGTYFWRSNATAVATVDPTGVVTGITAGTAVISYADSNSCGTMASSATVTVFPAPYGGILHPATVICVGAVTILTDSLVTAGTSVWGSSNSSIATVDTFGHVHGIDSGTVVIWHAVSNYCGTDTTRDTVIVHNAPHVGHISGESVMCNAITGSIHFYTDSVPHGIWSTSNIYLMSIGTFSGDPGDSTGIGTPYHAGIVIVYYTFSNLCGNAVASKFVTINPLPYASIITGANTVCAGSSTTLTDSGSGGYWISVYSNATVTGGVVTGISAGIDTIKYIDTNSCGTAMAAFPITINPLPVAGTIIGSSYACIGYVDTLYDSIAGGHWSATNITLLTVDSLHGWVRGISAGIDTIKYTVTTPSCGTAFVQIVDTVLPFPTVGPISGPDSVCTGSSITLTDTTAGGVWSVYNANASVMAGVGDSGIVTGLLQGYDTVYFINTAACGARAVASHLVKVKPVLNPGVITGPNALCQFTSILLTDTITGGVWSSLKNNSIVTSSGKDSATHPGFDTILYTVSNSCGTYSASFPITISPAPFAGGIVNSPPLHDTGICLGSKMKVSDSIAGGIWFVNNINAVLNLSTDSVVGYTPGKDTIFYVYTNSCGSDTTKLDIFYIYPLPYLGSIIFSTVPNALCLGASDTVSATEFGANWTSTNPSVASVVTFGSTFGAITALRPGNDSIIFTLPVHNCISSKVFLMKVLDTPDFVISPVINDNKCFGTNFGKITVTLTPDSIGRNIGPFSYEWSNGVSVIKTTSNTDYINSLVAGSYTVTITEPGTHCLRIDSFIVVQPDPISLNDSIKNDTCKTGNGAIWLAVTGGTRPYTYAWSNLTTDTFLTNLFAATYTITVTDSNNCVLDTGLNVMEGTCFDIVIYDVITPNGDGVNDVWVIKGIDDYPDNEVQVFDKWGDLVYSKSHYLNEWGGIANNGTALPDGTYFYIVKLNAVNASGHGNVKTGSILIKH